MQNQFHSGAERGAIDVRGFIQKNYTPYEGGADFLCPPTARTRAMLAKVQALLRAESEKGGVLDIDTGRVSSLLTYPAGYIDRENELIVGLQTDAPLKRGVNPFGGIRMARQACEAYGYKLSDLVETEFSYKTTHNDAVFHVYTDEMKAVRHAGLLTGLPDAYGRGRIIGDYRRVALYGVDKLIEEKQKDKAAYGRLPMSEANIRTLEELYKQIDFLKKLKDMALLYGIDISAPEGVEVLAVRSGTIAKTGWDNTDGNYVLLDHGDGLTTLYGCLSACSVQTGEVVEQGGVLGKVGATGAATGPHLHLEVSKNGALVDPLSCFPPLPEGDEPSAEPTVQGTDFTYGGHTYDLTERSPAITSITAMEWVGDQILLECHTGPKNNIYIVFDPQTETFVRELAGTHLIWRGEDLTTAVYAFWGDICAYDGTVLAVFDLGENCYISGLSFTEDGRQIEVEITENGEQSTQLVALP